MMPSDYISRLAPDALTTARQDYPEPSTIEIYFDGNLVFRYEDGAITAETPLPADYHPLSIEVRYDNRVIATFEHTSTYPLRHKDA